MACMDHICRNCGHIWFDNVVWPKLCPECQSSDVVSHFDEEGNDEPNDMDGD